MPNQIRSLIFTARFFPIASGLIFLLAGIGCQAASSPDQPKIRPNFLFILSDDKRWDALGAAGNPKIHTPILDAFAQRGVYFTQATDFVAQCCPSRAVLLTGVPPHINGYYSNQYQTTAATRPTGFDIPTLPGLLVQAGYQTVLVGKWHLLPDPWQCGFTQVRDWLPIGFGQYKDPWIMTGNIRSYHQEMGYTTDVYAKDADTFLRSPEAQAKPFLLWFAPTAPHVPHDASPERFTQLYSGKTVKDLLPPAACCDSAVNLETAEDWQMYYAAISHLDEQIGKLLETLKATGLDKNTIIIFASDNGLMMGSRNADGKVIPYDDSVRVPVMMFDPLLEKSGHGENIAAISTIDIPTTILPMAGIRPPSAWPGRNITPLLEGKADADFDSAVVEWSDEWSDKFGKLCYREIRTAKSKLVIWQDATRPDELYDLEKDPRETTNLIADGSLKPLRDRLFVQLETWMRKTDDPARQWPKCQPWFLEAFGQQKSSKLY